MTIENLSTNALAPDQMTVAELIRILECIGRDRVVSELRIVCSVSKSQQQQQSGDEACKD